MQQVRAAWDVRFEAAWSVEASILELSIYLLYAFQTGGAEAKTALAAIRIQLISICSHRALSLSLSIYTAFYDRVIILSYYQSSFVLHRNKPK
jgi:hypothetical protein